ncbi:probable (Lyso)-N-acylphosphatidylethanolamine lipase at C-terminar half [Coccomyxa sp. Obi]|nr:probable (Lyso)-N-acylphosphatidylethanolamine lipase at C-terminar half [Coccomyxa sp. Obi]
MLAPKSFFRRFPWFKGLVQQISSLRPLQSGSDREQHPRLPGDVLAQVSSSWRRITPALEEAMASISPATAEAAEASSTSLPWYIRYTRWKPTSRGEAVAAECNLLGLCSTQLDIRDVAVGEGRQEFMHTISGRAGRCAADGAAARVWRGGRLLFLQHRQAAEVSGADKGGSGGLLCGALAKWREAMGMEKVILVGHSLGGYLAASYALQHPEHVQHLVLVGPAGVPQDNVESRPRPQVNRWSMRGQLYHLSHTLWEAGATPGTLIRGLGPWGPSLIQKYARNRFREGMGLSDKEVAAFEEYFYHIMAARGSGEHALRHLLAPFTRARHPLEGRLQHIKEARGSVCN